MNTKTFFCLFIFFPFIFGKTTKTTKYFSSSFPFIISIKNLTIGPTSFPVEIINENPWKYILIFYTSYNEIKKNLSFNENQIKIIKDELGKYFSVIPARINQLKIITNNDDNTVINFLLNSGNFTFTSNMEAHKSFQKNIKIIEINVKTFKIKTLIKYCKWIEKDELGFNEKCEKIKKKTKKTNKLLALIIIPIIIIIIIIFIIFIYFFKYRKPKEKKSLTLNEMGYVENKSKFGIDGTGSQNQNIGTLSIANSTIRNQAYSNMAKSYGFSSENAEFENEKDGKDGKDYEI